jgi:predicted dithiol-disulfide oxidoreductase (DUF899 family)
VTPAAWTKARVALLAKEKDATRAYAAMLLERRQLPWMKVADYTFTHALSGKKAK